MSIFLSYLFVATATPLFLWIEKRNWAPWQMPFLILLWVFFGLYISTDLSLAARTLFIILFIGNVLFAHIAAFSLWVPPLLERRKQKGALLTKKGLS